MTVEEYRVVVGSAEHVALWDAINSVVSASGGSTSTTSLQRQLAVVAVERALAALVAKVVTR